MALTGYAEDLEAINHYVINYPEHKLTIKAKDLKKDWIIWYSKLSWTDLNFSKEFWILGRKKRDDFNTSLGYQIEPTGITSEQMYPQGIPGSVLAETYSGSTTVLSKTNNTIVLALITGTVIGLIYLTKK